MVNKLFEATLILNWKTKGMRIVKKMPKKSNVGAFEIPVKISINVKVPEMQEIVAKGEIEIPAHKVKEMVLETL